MASMQVIEKSFSIKKNSTSWRDGATLYQQDVGGYKPGTLSLSPAWFQQAQSVSIWNHCMAYTQCIKSQKTKPLEVSKKLRSKSSQDWLKKQVESTAIIGGILSIIHPEQYRLGIQMLHALLAEADQIKNGELIPHLLQIWNAPFNVITMISNRLTPFHRDSGAASPWYDLLVALGEYANGRIEFPGLGQRFDYEPGTVVGMTARILRHGVHCPGNRVCVAYHNKSCVMDSLGLARGTWMKTSFYSTS